MIHRRQFLRIAAAGCGTMLIAPRLVFANVETDRRFVFIIQRGAADGLDTVVPYADPGYAALRRDFAVDPAAALRLDGTFALHPSLAELGKLYGKGQALFVQAVASPYRDRSHFDGQNVLETGGSNPYQLKDGWLNRLVSLMPRSHDEAIAFAPTVPLALRGKADVTSYAPSALPPAPDDLLMRVGALYESDPQLHPLWSAAMEARGLADDAQARQDPASIGKTAAGFLARDDGPRIAMIETSGWDTHSGQMFRLANQLKALDTLIASLRDNLGDAWAKTTVLVATEFGRTAAVNGTGGTDHGTASSAMVLGGAVKGGRILADWPGLAQGSLYEGRDLAPTLDLDALIAAVAAESLGLDTDLAMRTLFPGRPFNKALHGLVGA
ncbi:DUF1501 domain-containing protein [Oryzicola mucosus]|uniref:DUF1501 domain-containing protein n=1 Tax=Oryzicola mucosus TaxID=2767425 RepID=A0A8J6PKW9_9HYPH|nr:DUF1501 domain-containing protein [Oryzicola mucosus]MBD0413212.1 DUF1501 domain-containing protein [Oryzicola mucosus]